MRGVPAPLERALNAALSRGPGYEPTPIGPDFDDRSVRGYYIDFRPKTTASTAADPGALPAIQLIQLALGWAERALGGEDAARERFVGLCAAIEERGEPRSDGLRWPMRVEVPKYGLAQGWSSALAQGQAASAFVRAYLLAGDDHYAELARRAIEPFLAPETTDLVVQTASGPILEEAPSKPSSHVLNGWMSALWGLWDVQLGLGDEGARTAFDAGIGCLQAMLPKYDTGWWTRYALYPHALPDLAKPIYHRFHVTQLRVYHRLTGDGTFQETAARWDAYDRAPNRLAAIAQKGAFSVVEARRRRRWRLSRSAPASRRS
jgi:heparosan-N-sulfate-glucuronate 5-epimerase